MSIRHRHSGFTLIELVMVVVILGILATAVTNYIVFGTRVYVEGTARQETLTKSRFVIDRISRELRNAMPYSIRVYSNKSCMHFVPIVASGAYRTDSGAVTPPITPVTGNELDVISWTGTYTAGDRLYIYPTEFVHIYVDADRFKVIDAINDTNAPNIRLDFDSSLNTSAFAAASPRERYYTGNSTVFYCVVGGNMYRWETNSISNAVYSEYTIAATGVLMAEGLTNIVASEPPFSYDSGTLYRNSVVTLYLEFNANDSDDMFFNHEVHIPNVP